MLRRIIFIVIVLLSAALSLFFWRASGPEGSDSRALSAPPPMPDLAREAIGHSTVHPFEALNIAGVLDRIEVAETREESVQLTKEAVAYLLVEDRAMLLTYFEGLSYLQIRSVVPAYMFMEWYRLEPEAASLWFEARYPYEPVDQSVYAMNLRAQVFDSAFPTLENGGELDTGLKATIAERVVGEQAVSLPADVVRLIDSFDDTLISQRAELAFAAVLAKETPELYFEYLPTLDATIAEQSLTYWAASEISRDPESVIHQLNSLGDGYATTDIIGQSLRGWANHDSEAAVAYTHTLNSDQAETTRLLSYVAAAVSDQDSELGYQLFEESGLSGDQVASDINWRQVIANWAFEDNHAAAAVWQDSTDPVFRDLVASELVDAYSSYDPETAAGWAGRIQDPVKRQRWEAELGLDTN